MKVLTARLSAFAFVAIGVGYLAVAQLEADRLNRELQEDTGRSDRLDEMNQQMHQRMCEKLNLPEDVVRYGYR